MPEPKPPILHLGINEEGKMHAEYDPANLTESALAIIVEVARPQQHGRLTKMGDSQPA